MHRILFGWLLAVAVSATALAGEADKAAEEQKIRQLDAAWAAAVQDKDVARTVAFYADDGKLLPAGMPPAEGHAEIAAAWEGMFALPGFSLTFAPETIVVHGSGDVAYDIGIYRLKTEAGGVEVVDNGKYLVVWEKRGGEWKVVADMFNSNGS